MPSQTKVTADKRRGGRKRSRTYSDRERAEALVVLDSAGGVVERAARVAGVPAKTLEEWAKGRVSPHVRREREEVRRELAQRLAALARKMHAGGLRVVAG